MTSIVKLSEALKERVKNSPDEIISYLMLDGQKVESLKFGDRFCLDHVEGVFECDLCVNDKNQIVMIYVNNKLIPPSDIQFATPIPEDWGGTQ